MCKIGLEAENCVLLSVDSVVNEYTIVRNSVVYTRFNTNASLCDGLAPNFFTDRFSLDNGSWLLQLKHFIVPFFFVSHVEKERC